MAIIPKYENNREFNYTPYAQISKAAADFDRQAFSTIADGMRAMGQELEQLQKEEDTIKAQQFAAEYNKAAGMFLSKAGDNSKNGKLIGSQLGRYDEISSFIEPSELDGLDIHDGMTMVNKSFDEKAATTLTKDSYKIFKKLTLDSGVNNTLKAYQMYRTQKKANQTRLLASNLATVGSLVPSAKQPISEGLRADASIEKLGRDASNWTFMNKDDVSEYTRQALAVNAETAIAAAISRGQYDQALYQLGVDADFVKSLTPEDSLKFGVYWDVEANAVKTLDGKLVLQDIDVVGSYKQHGVPKLVGTKEMRPDIKLSLINKAIRSMTTKAKTDVSMVKQTVRDGIANGFAKPLSNKQDINLRKNIHNMLYNPNIKIKDKVDAIGDYYVMKTVGKYTHDIPYTSEADFDKLKAELTKEMNNIDVKTYFGEVANMPEVAEYIKPPKFKQDLKQRVLQTFDAQVKAIMKARSEDPAGYVMGIDPNIGDQYSRADKYRTDVMKATDDMQKANKTRDLNGIQVAKGQLENANGMYTNELKYYVDSQLKTQDGLGIKPWNQRLIPKQVMDNYVAKTKEALATGDTAALMRAVEEGKNLYGGNAKNPPWQLKRSFFRQIDGKLPPVIEASLTIKDPFLAAELLKSYMAGKEVYNKDAQVKSKISAAITSNKEYRKAKNALMANSAANDRLHYDRVVYQTIEAASYKHLIAGDSPSEAVQKAIDTYLPSLQKTVSYGGIMGFFDTDVLVTADAEKNTGLPAEGIVKRMEVLQDWARQGKVKFNFTPEVKEMQARAMFNKKWSELTADEKKEAIGPKVRNMIPKLATDGSIMFIDGDTQVAIPFEVKHYFDKPSYVLKPDELRYMIDEQDTVNKRKVDVGIDRFMINGIQAP